MRVLKKITLGLIATLVLVQIPFIYRRYQTGKLSNRITASNSQRTVREHAGHNEFKGIIHAHTSLGGHSKAGFDELIDAANSNGLDFVLMTEHYSERFDTSALTLNGLYGNTLFIGGNEVDTADSDRFLLVPGSGEAPAFRERPTSQFLNTIHSEGKLAFITYPERFRSWDSNFDGIEVFSLHTAAKSANPLIAFFDLIWTFPAYPELTLAANFERPDTNLRRFDETSMHRKVSLFAGTDAHSNIGFHLFGDETGKSLIGAKIDPYETVFRIARLHILLPKDTELSRENLVAALAAGNYFTGFDIIGDTTGFSFTAENASETIIMGGETTFAPEMTLTANAPQPARFNIYKNGGLFATSDGSGDLSSTMPILPNGPGVYRVEVYLDALGSPFDKMPWIISNPIYIR